MGETRKLAAILVADVVGYSRLAAADEDRTLARLRGLRSDLTDPAIAAHHGRIVKRTGDGLIAEFRSVVDAVRCAIEIQIAMVERNAGVAADKRVEFRIGVHLGDVVEEADGTSWATASISPRAWRASPTLGRSAFPRTPIAKSRDGLIWRSPTWAKLSSRTSPIRSGSIRSRSASPRPPKRSLRRSWLLKDPTRRASRSSFCHLPISAATRSRSISSTGSRKVSRPTS